MYKVGDKICINSDLITSEGHYTVPVVRKMEDYRGRIATIQKVCALRNGKTYYRIDIDNHRWGWTPDMFTLVEENEIDLQVLLNLI